MKIRELLEAGLTGIKKYQDMPEWEFSKLMAQSGFEYLNGGEHASVYHRDNDPFVYRVAKNDSLYEKYAEFLLKSPTSNPHFPKIYGIKSLPNFFKRAFPDRWSMFNIVKVEYIPHLMNEAEFKEFDYVFRGSWLRDGVFYSQFDPQGKWRSLVTALHEIFKNIPGSPDIHRKNFGKRADGTFVILDPVWEGETPYAAHDRAMRAETDFDPPDEDNIQYVTGPWNKRREQQHQDAINHWRSSLPPDDDDIPF